MIASAFMFFPYLIGIIFLLLSVICCVCGLGSKDEKFLLRASTVFLWLGLTGPAISIATLCYDCYCGAVTTNIGVGTVVRLDNSVGKHSVTTHTLVRLKGTNYNCYGYVPNAKEAVIETKRVLTGLTSYTCELPE